MVEISNVDLLKNNTSNYNDVKAVDKTDEEDVSLFNGEEFYSVQVLKSQLSDVEANNGVFLDGWDDFKKFSNLGMSSDDCDDAIEQYKQGKITFEQAEAKINKYKEKQENSLNLFSNVATGIAGLVAGAAVVGTGGLAAVGVGALAGAATKAGMKTLDRATNKVEDDALDGKQIAKDALSGAVTGGIAVATAGTGSDAFNNGFSIGGKKVIDGGAKACMASSAKTGITTGAISGASNNLIECAFEDDKEFNVGDFAQETITSAAVGGMVGTAMGGFNGVLRNNGVLNETIDNDTTKALVTNAACNAEYKGANEFVRNTGRFIKNCVA